MRKFNVGDKVQLISGSDEMTVYAVYGLRLVECEWKGKEGKTYRNWFRPDYLELSDVKSTPFPEGHVVKNELHRN